MDDENLFNKLLMETGSPLHLIVSGRSFKGRFIGFKPPEYLVIDVPRSEEIDAALAECHEIVGCFCVSGTVIRFESSISARLKKPAWLLVVAYPHRLSKIRDLRTSYRAQCSLPCTLVTLLNLNQYSGLITDISADGCKCIPSSISLSQAQKLFNSEKKVLLEFELPGGHGRTRLFGEVAGVRRDGTEISLGIKFEEHHDEAAVKELQDYVSNVVRLPSA
jgi:c-di-GMP-binding flagellar brake protein YcgR